MTIKHYFDFKESNEKMNLNLLTKDSWDMIRVEEENTPFSIPSDRRQWIKKCTNLDSKELASEIIKVKNELGCESIVSVGIGMGSLEYTIKSIDKDLYLVCLDYAPKAIERLRNVFTECDEIEEFDMTSKNWFYRKDALYLLNRVSTEFSDAEWQEIFKNMKDSGIKNVIYVPTEYLSIEVFIKAKLRYIFNKIKGKTQCFAGYMRTRNTFLTLWNNYYEVYLDKKIKNYQLIVLKIRT